MWKHWVNGILGLLIVLLPYLGLTSIIEKFVLVVTRVIIAILAFWSLSEGKMAKAKDNQNI